MTRSCLRAWPSIDTQTSLLSCTNSSRSVAPKNAIWPPSRFVDAFARRATALENPNDATLTKCRWPSPPSVAR